MSELFFEILTEEIPARMQARAAEDLLRLVSERLTAAQLAHTGARVFVTPRRLALVVEGLLQAQPDLAEERKGPRAGSPEGALAGFLKGAGLASLDEAELRETEKGAFWFATIRRAGRATAAVLPEILGETMRQFPWPKSMRFPAAPFRWVRPITSVVALLDGEVLPLALGDVPVGRTTRGHRFLAGDAAFEVADFADYRARLAASFVLLDPAERRAAIAEALATEAAAENLALEPDLGLLDEVTGLVEHPVVLSGALDEAFLALPPEVLTTSMRAHQKYFACRRRDGGLAPRFLVVANNAAADGGAAIRAGNERVLRARLSDAKFFWDQDRRVRLDSRVETLRQRIFHAELGTVREKVDRIAPLAAEIAGRIGADPALASRAAWLAKADLSTGMVGEFPELQGVMGRYYAAADGEAPAVAAAIAEHYAPLGPSDRCPAAPVSVAVALADKIDTLVGFFAIGELPTGSKDPFALRRAALGVIRLVLENGLRLPLAEIFATAHRALGRGDDPRQPLLTFFADRLQVALREKGTRHDLIAAVFALGGEDDLVRLLARVAALGAFLETEDGASLLVAYRRAVNILRIEEKKDGRAYAGDPDPASFALAEEHRLAAALEEAGRKAASALAAEDYRTAMAALAGLRAPVDAFFEGVIVNAAETELRDNRLRLLSRIRATLHRVADFSKIDG